MRIPCWFPYKCLLGPGRTSNSGGRLIGVKGPMTCHVMALRRKLQLSKRIHAIHDLRKIDN